MKKLVVVLSLIFFIGCSASDGPSSADPRAVEWEARAANVTIKRDDWGVPHISAATDADAVFGLMYAQAEDDFNRIENNFLLSMGRLAEAEGEAELWRDLRMQLFIDPDEMRAMYAESPAFLRDLMDAWADGLNYYLHTHPETTPRVITDFEPWMALTFSEGSIGGDIERVNLGQLEAFYGARDGATMGDRRGVPFRDRLPDRIAVRDATLEVSPSLVSGIDELSIDDEPRGSNGFAIAPSNTADGNALLLINPHTSFFFRHEAHVTSDEGLDAYGALTWGQFFIYQGFNEDAGWMHTSSRVDNIDEFLETIDERDGAVYYDAGDDEQAMESRVVTLRYRTGTGMGERSFTVYRTHRGPIVREVDGRWVSIALMEEPLSALIQSYNRTKAANLDEFLAVMDLHTNSSNNTVFADSEGNIAYLHSNFIPRRDDSFDWSRPVDGGDPATAWNGVLSFEESPNVINPPNGWIQNTNNWPYSAAGDNSPDRDDYPPYVDVGTENPRGIHAMQVLDTVSDFTIESLMASAYDSYLTGFVTPVPAVIAAYDAAPASHPLKTQLADPIEQLRGWDFRFSVESIPTSIAMFWGDEMGGGIERAAPDALLQGLATAIEKLEEDFGTWQTPWGEINRFQRLTGDIVQPFNDDGPSTPVGFASARWGSLASFGARAYPETKRWYGTSGNSFVAVVEFGDRVRAYAVTAGGLNSDPASPHFNDQAERYATGNLREVYYYPDQLEGHVEREYHPGG